MFSHPPTPGPVDSSAFVSLDLFLATLRTLMTEMTSDKKHDNKHDSADDKDDDQDDDNSDDECDYVSARRSTLQCCSNWLRHVCGIFKVEINFES